MTKRVISPFAVWVDGSPVAYSGGVQVADDDPILATHGEHFADVDTFTRPRRSGPEAATAAPGEHRTRTTPPAPPSEPPAPTPGPQDTPPPGDPYDPTAHTVPDVLAYLDGLQDQAEAVRVLDAEQAAAAPRAGIVGQRDKILARYAS